jgi:lysophospholipase L1-like esterase
VAVAALAPLLLLAALASPAAASGRGRPEPPERYLLSLGDSMAFGIQFDRLDQMLADGTYDPDAFDTGYTDELARRLRRIRPDQRTVNLSCPGESTDTMIHGGCSFTAPPPDGPGLALHEDYAGPQLRAAVSFLQDHRDQVNPIVVSIGGNDAVDAIAEVCGADAACLERSGLRERVGRNLDRILGSLRRAAPEAEIVLLAFYNPFALDHPETDPLWRRFHVRVQKEAARRNGAEVAVVPKVVRPGNVCELTFLCASGDLHPTDEGYRRIGKLVFNVAGFDRLG